VNVILFYLTRGFVEIASIDHKIPTSKGGTNELSNLQWVDFTINVMKYNQLHGEFLQTITDVLSYTTMPLKL
jgi:hypothetical protein